MYYDKDGNTKDSFTLFKYLKKIWNDVNQCSGNAFKFDLDVSHNKTSIVRVIDRNSTESDLFNKLDMIFDDNIIIETDVENQIGITFLVFNIFHVFLFILKLIVWRFTFCGQI